MTITVRPAVITDFANLRTLFLHSRRQTFVWQKPEAFHLEDFDAQTQGEHLFVAEDESQRLCGFVSVWEPNNFIHHLYVDRRYTRRGVGRALLYGLLDWGQARYQLKCLRKNKSALAFYFACGFIEAGAGAGDDGEYLLLESNFENYR